MVKTVNLHEAKTHLSRLVRRVQSGEEVVIARDGTPVARLIAMESTAARALGWDRGRFFVPDDFNEPLDPSILGEVPIVSSDAQLDAYDSPEQDVGHTA